MSGQPSQGARFREYVEPEIKVLLRVARTLTGSTADADDLVQETLIRAWRAVDHFDGNHPRAWLLTILRRTHINMHRRKRPDLVEDPAHELSARPAFGAARSVTPEEKVLDGTLGDDVASALAELDPKFRTTLLLVDVDKLSYAQAAETLGVPVGTVMSRLSRARDRMRASLQSRSRVSRALEITSVCRTGECQLGPEYAHPGTRADRKSVV